jgi:hypothetical protein
MDCPINSPKVICYRMSLIQRWQKIIGECKRGKWEENANLYEEAVNDQGQVRIAIKSSTIQNTKAPIHSLACFGQKFERTVFERMTSSHHLYEQSDCV